MQRKYTARESLTDEQYQELYTTMKVRLEKIRLMIDSPDTAKKRRLELIKIMLNAYFKDEVKLSTKEWFIQVIKATED